MKFFIDTANLKEIKDLVTTGMVDGVTTNPSLVAKEGVDFKSRIIEICKIVDGPVSAEVSALDFKTMVKEGEVLAALHKNVVVKIPLTWDGLQACKILTDQDIPVNVTLCFSVNQALLAAKAGATFISPFIGRLDDIHLNGMQLIKDIVLLYSTHFFDTEILAASIRTVNHVQDAALAGANIATIPAKILKSLVEHPLTQKGLDTFVSDWQNTGQSIL